MGLHVICGALSGKPSNGDRVTNREGLVKLLIERLGTKTNDEWTETLEGIRLPYRR
ncbi:hypothetical protein DOTSEDRAFT_27300 [Dothistroma septosporum NZE10]|uniref:Uncharacterized protein n=1 Tax=Dothistroma septosporum (strain NZE10 / CBS 128990) TaxID=675120 RepID=N1PEB0_DOTSN|nr:hypothetical protein DOTSEDRAFT_27300 [Dothistroma septosporum NZE10]